MTGAQRTTAELFGSVFDQPFCALPYPEDTHVKGHIGGCIFRGVVVVVPCGWLTCGRQLADVGRAVLLCEVECGS